MNSPCSASGDTVAVRPEGKRRINLPSEVMPTTRARTEPPRRCGESSEKPCGPRARLDVDATDFFLLCELDWLAVAGCVASSGFEDGFISLEEEGELSAIGCGEVGSEAFGAVAGD